jgi:hypothetical protein
MSVHNLRHLDDYCRQQDGRCVVCRRYDTGGGGEIHTLRPSFFKSMIIISPLRHKRSHIEVRVG